MDWNRKKALIVIVIAAAVGAALVAVGVAWMFGPRPRVEPAPNFGQVPAFELISQHEQPVTLDDLAGKVWLAEFIFTSCRGICPIMVQNMAAVREELVHAAEGGSASGGASEGVEDVRFVSFTVDPEHDTPEVLREYARQHNAEGDDWLFLTAAEREPIWRLSQEGFMLGVSETPENPLMPISHSGKFVLVDRQGQIRGYYSGTTPDEREMLVADIRQLLRE